MVLVLTQSTLQESTLSIMLRLGGHTAHVVTDEHEAINMIKNVPRSIRGVVIGAAGCQTTLAKRIETFSTHRITTPIYLVGLADRGREGLEKFNFSEPRINLSIFTNEELLECLSGSTG